MKFLFDFFPVILFFVAYKIFGIYTATAVAIVASIAQVGFYWLKNRRAETMHLITLVLIVVLGGATLLLQNELFIKWKPTAINWAFAVILLASHAIGGKPLLQRMMESKIKLNKTLWQRLSYSWVVFFTFMGAANIYVAYAFSTDTWVNFKLFGVLGLTIVFVILQAIFLAKHVSHEEKQI